MVRRRAPPIVLLRAAHSASDGQAESRGVILHFCAAKTPFSNRSASARRLAGFHMFAAVTLVPDHHLRNIQSFLYVELRGYYYEYGEYTLSSGIYAVFGPPT